MVGRWPEEAIKELMPKVEALTWEEERALIKRGDCDELSQAEESLLSFLRAYREENLPRPSCCEEIQKKHEYCRSWPVWLEVDYEDNIDPPRWTSSDMGEISFCPFCGTKLPEIEKRPDPPHPLCVVDDGCHYCETCGERLMGCSCWHPAAAYRAAK